MSRKGVTGKILTLIISLVLGIAALALIWFFLTNSSIIINESIEKAVEGFKCKVLCEGFLRLVNVGTCSGC